LLLDTDIDEPSIAIDAPVAMVRIDRHAPDVAQWMSNVGLQAALAVLIRPDGHILDVAETAEELTRFSVAIVSLLFHPHPAGVRE
jgi:hypothetical protein